MSRALALSQRQVTALCKGAEKAGYIALVEVGNVVVRLIPEKHAVHAQSSEKVDEEEDFRL